jgi:hypothetical protein
MDVQVGHGMVIPPFQGAETHVAAQFRIHAKICLSGAVSTYPRQPAEVIMLLLVHVPF